MLGINISEERNLFVAENFIRSLVEKYGRHNIVYTDGGTWYDEACNVIGLKYHLHSPLEKIFIELINQYLKDRMESFDDYYRYMQKECILFHVHNWLQFFVSMYNDTTSTKDNYFVNQLQEEMVKLT